MSLEWIETKLADVGTFERGKSKHRPRDAIHLYGGLYPFIQTGDITAAGGKITNFRQTYNEKGLAQSKLWESNTLCITIAANIAETALLTFPACFPDSVVGFIPDANKADVRFVEYLFRAFRREVKSKAYGSVQENINLEVLRNLKFPIPPLQIQNTIADFLSLFDDRITLLRETNATLEAIAQALFKSWFVDFDPVHAKAQGRQPEGMDEQTAALFSDRFVESELGMVPAGWKISNLDNVSEVGIGKTPPRKEAHWFTENSSDVRWVSIRDMGNCGAFISTTSEYLTDTAIERLNVRKVPNNTVLLSFKMTIGRVAISDGNMTTNEAIAHFKLTDNSPISSEFIYLHLKQFNYSTLSSTSSIADAVNSKTVKSIPIIVPSADILSEFQSVIGNVFEQIKTIQHQTETLTDLRDTLLPRLISGQLRLPDVEAQ